jgi:predicted RNA-binding Zn ribbon-like protein
VAKTATEFQFDLTGGQLALDLANTISHRDDPVFRNEHLTGYADLLAFARQAGAVSRQQANEISVYGQRHTAEAARSFKKIISLREAIYRAFAAIATKKSPAPADLALLNDFAIGALQHRCLARSNGGYKWQWRADEKSPLDRILWAAAQAAAELLTSSDLRIVRFCQAPDCEWLFLDHSRNHSRRWCDMTICGNREKARRHYQRSRE